MRITARRAIAAAIVLPIISLAAACGSDDSSASDKAGENLAEKMIESGSDEDVDVDIDGDEVTVETDEGTTSYGGKERPESLPDDFPLAEGEIITTMDSPDGAMISIKVDGDLTEAFDEALSTLEGQGWKREMRSESGTSISAMLTGETPDETVMLSGDSDTGELTYVVSYGG